MNVKPCNTYAAKSAGTTVYRDGRTAFKVYYVSIYGREHPERYEWDLCDLSCEAVVERLKELGIEGVGFVLAFPHIVKVFRFGPEAETLLNVRAFKPGDGEPIPLERAEGYTEFACLAEADVASREYLLWAAAESVEEYLGKLVTWGPLPIIDHEKLGRYWSE